MWEMKSKLDLMWIDRGTWQRRRPWWPRTCRVTGDWLWLQPAYCNTVMFTGPGEPVLLQTWCSVEAFVWLQLKGSAVSELLVD